MSLKKAIVHIGNVKTGTTAIQAVLRVLRPELALAGVLMPGLKPVEPAHYAIAKEWKLPKARTLRSALIFEDIAAAGADKTILMTAETLINVPAAKLKEKLVAAGCGSFKIILYVRPHISLLGSFYLQNLKMGIIRGPIGEHLGMLRGGAMQFLRVAEDYGQAFGRGNVIVREFHRSVLNDGSVVTDFSAMPDLPASLLQKAEQSEQIANPTPTAEIALILRACSNWLYNTAPPRVRLENEAAPDGTGSFRVTTAALFQALMAHKSDLPVTRFNLPVYLQQALNDRFRDERQAFAARWFAQKPSAFWVDEKIEAPQPLLDLPALTVKTALKDALVRLRKTEKSKVPQALMSFREALPIVGSAPNRKVATGSLAATFSLADDVPPKDAALKRLLTPQ